MTLVIDEYINDPEYFEKKARELIIEAKYSMDQSSDPEFRTKHGLPVYKEKMQKAVFCLAVARWIREN